ncbi:unnamed protein product [Leuciscus chuanchicus]
MSTIPFDPANLLLSMTQDYMEEFPELAHLVPWNDDTMETVFWSGLNNHLFRKWPSQTPMARLRRPILPDLLSCRRLPGQRYRLGGFLSCQHHPGYRPRLQTPSLPASPRPVSIIVQSCLHKVDIEKKATEEVCALIHPSVPSAIHVLLHLQKESSINIRTDLLS